MHIKLNGTTHTLDDTPDNLLLLLQTYNLTNGRFAVEVDGRLVPKSHLQSTPVIEGMCIEVVQAVGGG